MSARYTALQIADFFVQLANSLPDDSIDNLKINKIVYFAQGRALASLGRPLFDDQIEAWDYGPVVPSVYKAFKCCGKSPIAGPESTFDESQLSSDELNLLTDVYVNYGKYTGIALKEMTHRKGTPWSVIYEQGENRVIPLELIEEWFKNDTDFVPFTINTANAGTITAVPASWDSEED